jgi:multidrug efflux pump subunit AcrB
MREKERLESLVDELKKQMPAQEKTFQKFIKEKISIATNEQSKTINKTLKERGEQAQKSTWEMIVDEMAHSFNTDIFNALHILNKRFDDNEYTKRLRRHITEIRDLNDLIMFYLKREEYRKNAGDKKPVELNLSKVLTEQLQTVQAGLDTLRLSTREHKTNLSKLMVQPEINGNVALFIDEDLQKAFNLLFKDLIRNAFKNTYQENPVIEIKLFENKQNIIFEISNNKLMPENFRSWFLAEESMQDVQMSKSSKVGLRLLKKWFTYLKIKYDVVLDAENGMTKIQLTIPREIHI